MNPQVELQGLGIANLGVLRVFRTQVLYLERGSWDLVTMVITVLTKSHEPPSRASGLGDLGF